MHIIFQVPMLGIRQHFGMAIGEFTTKHRRLGVYQFDIGKGCRRFIPEAMCLVEEYSDEEWQKMEKEKADAAAAKKKADEAAAAEAKALEEKKAEAQAAAAAAARAIAEAKKFRNRIKRLFGKK
jgi:hypothetical protein